MTPASQRSIISIQAHIDEQRIRLLFLQANAAAIDAIDVPPSGFGKTFDFDYLTHEQITRVMLLFPGKWTKTYDGAVITYTREADLEGYVVRCYHGQPPPNCKVVEEEVEVAEKLIPAHKELRRKIVCDGVEVKQEVA